MRHIITLADDANVLIVNGERQLLAFDKKYGVDQQLAPNHVWHQIDWRAVAKDYDGIIIAPYVWSCHLGFGRGGGIESVSCWYYPWDCASGCIWNAKAIAAFTVAEEEERV